MEQTEFLEASMFNRSGQPRRTYRKDVPLYVGDPSPAVDQNWNELLDDQYFYITAQEAKDAWGEDHSKYWKDEETNQFRTGVGVLHSLHCLVRYQSLVHVHSIAD